MRCELHNPISCHQAKNADLACAFRVAKPESSMSVDPAHRDVAVGRYNDRVLVRSRNADHVVVDRHTLRCIGRCARSKSKLCVVVGAKRVQGKRVVREATHAAASSDVWSSQHRLRKRVGNADSIDVGVIDACAVHCSHSNCEKQFRIQKKRLRQQTKPNQTKPNQTKPNQTNQNSTVTYE